MAPGRRHESGATSHPTDSGFGYHVGTVHNLGADFFTRTVGGQVQSFATSYFTYKKIGTQLVNGAKTGVFETQLVDGVSYPFYSVYANPFQPSADESNYSFPQRYATRDTAEEAIERIDGDGTGDLPEPWLLYVAFNAAHSPFHIPPSNLSPTSQVPASGRLYTLTTTLSSTPTEPELHRAMVESMDIEIGRILAAIPTAPLDVRARTTVIFVADNGSPSKTADAPFTASKVKGSLFEGGINVPFILMSPRLAIAAANKGKQSTGLGTAADLFETVRDIANDFATGVGTGGGTDSRSLVPFAVDPNLGSENAIPDDSQHAFVYAENFKPKGLPSPDWDPTDPSQPAPPLPPLAKNPILPSFQDSYKRAIRGPRYKLIREHGLDARLYDLQTDPLESTNLLGQTSLAQEQATLVTAMNALVGLPQRCSGGNDIDGDGYCDHGDKCVLIPDPDPDANRSTQSDTDDDDPDGPGGPLQAPDGYGNACDGDFDGSEHVAIGDFNTYKSCFEKVVPASGPADDPTCAEADMNSTGSVTIGDFNLFKRTFGKEPGPSCGFAEVPGCRGFPGL